MRHDIGLRSIQSYGGAPIRDGRGEAILAINTFRDIMAQKQAEQSLHEAAAAQCRLEAGLRAAIAEADALTRELDFRVQERTAELLAANEELRRQAQLLTRAEERYSVLVNTTPDFIYSIDLNGRHTAVNRALCRGLQRPADEIVGKDHRELGFPEDVAQEWEELCRRVFAGEEVRTETCTPLPDGTEHIYEVILRPVRGAGDRIVGLRGVSRDITARKEAEDQKAVALAALQASREQLRALHRRLVEIQESERRNISRELHDETGQGLTVLKLGLARLQREPVEPAELQARISELQHVTDNIMEGLHRLAVNLRPTSLDRYGLVPALEQYAATVSKQAGLQVEFMAEGLNGQRLPDDIETSLYRVIQEALTNVIRHAQARHAAVVLRARAGDLIAIVEDDGVGFDVAEAIERGRLGLIGMRERIDMLGGKFHLESFPGRGTTVYVAVPNSAAHP